MLSLLSIPTILILASDPSSAFIPSVVTTTSNQVSIRNQVPWTTAITTYSEKNHDTSLSMDPGTAQAAVTGLYGLAVAASVVFVDPNKFSKLGSALKDSTDSFNSSVENAMEKAEDSVLGNIDEAGEKLAEKIEEASETIAEKAEKVGEEVDKQIQEKAENIGETGANIQENVEEVGGIGDNIKEKLDETSDDVIISAEEVDKKIQEKEEEVSDISNSIKEKVEVIGDIVKEKLINVVEEEEDKFVEEENITELVKSVANTLEGQREKLRLLEVNTSKEQAKISKPEVQQEEKTVVEDVQEETVPVKKGLRRRVFRVVKKIIMPWRKFSEID